MNFDEPLTKDPLFWAGLVVGLAGGLWGVLAKDLSGGDAVWLMVTSLFGGVWFWAGLIASNIRELYRRHRDRRSDIALLLKEDAVLKETE